MKSIEEKAKRKIERLDAENWLNENKDIWHHPIISDRENKNSYEVADLMAEFANEAYLAGYGESQRWISVEEELPKDGELVAVQVEYVSDYMLPHGYDYDRYRHEHKMWDIEQSAEIKVVAWRPID